MSSRAATLLAQAPKPRDGARSRPRVRGKFVFHGDEKLLIRGVTYGTFRPDEKGNQFGSRGVVARDFSMMAANGVNAVRTYTVPPRWLLDEAENHGLLVMSGIPWEQHITFLDDRSRIASIQRRVREAVRQCGGHPAVLCFSIGNEIPAPIVRWHGPKRVEKFLRGLYEVAKSEDPDALVTYVNYPTTEYLDLSFTDLLCFNVYLESREALRSYLPRLHNVAGDRPLIMAEVGLDSRRHSALAQAEALDWQIRTSFEYGCAGLFVFSWTDEWHRGGHEIEDWDFGITDRNRRGKLALVSVRNAFQQVEMPPRVDWPFISVVVCTYNGSRTIRRCLESLQRLAYPSFEVIVVDDGSTDSVGEIALECGMSVVRTCNRGLSAARNTGWQTARGKIVAYIDDDAFADPDWLTHLALAFRRTNHPGIGGPNLPAADDEWVAQCVADSPGGPIHVLLSDEIAEHIPGCNMAFRKQALEEVGGFDPQFRIAGDDVDLCWRMQQRGWTLGFSPAAQVWHHRRNSIRGYLRQQMNYGRAEAMLERKWPEKYNRAGHLKWEGRIYGNGFTRTLSFGRNRIYHGVWGAAPFQRQEEQRVGALASITLIPEWFLLLTWLALLCAAGSFWPPLLWTGIALPPAVLIIVAQAIRSARFPQKRQPLAYRLRHFGTTALLHVLQPLSRLWGRLDLGLSPWRRSSTGEFHRPWGKRSLWTERWKDPFEHIRGLERRLRATGLTVISGNEYSRWDLDIRAGVCGAVRACVVVEEHGGAKQMLRVRFWPVGWAPAVLLAGVLTFLSSGAAWQSSWIAAACLAIPAACVWGRMIQDSGRAAAALSRAFAGEPE